MTREHAMEAHEILDVLKRKYEGTYEEILNLVDLSDSTFEKLMGALQKDMANPKVRRRKG
jgi:DNA-binding IclR family transcriptional regulator